MKGTLKKRLGVWAVHYCESTGDEQHGHSTNIYKNLPLHPDDVCEDELDINHMDNVEVDFEIVKKYVEPPAHIHSNRGADMEFAKLVFDKKDETTWAAIFRIFWTTQNLKGASVVTYNDWLEKNYQPPVKKT